MEGLKFRRKSTGGEYRLNGGVLEGPAGLNATLTRLQERIAVWFLNHPLEAVSADQLPRILNRRETAEPTGYRSHITKVNKAFGFKLILASGYTGVSGDAGSRRASYRLSEDIELHKPSAPVPPAPLAIPRRTWSPNESPPAALLRAEFCIVPFFGRTDELTRIRTWREHPAALSVALLTGVGGRGKTRLAIEACHHARAHGWNSGFASLDALSSLLDSPPLPGRTFVVIDYAESDPSRIIHILAKATGQANPDSHPLRIVLLARSAGEWWETVRSGAPALTELLHHPARFLRLPLRELAQTESQSYELLSAARLAFRHALAGPEDHSHVAIKPLSHEALVLFTQALLTELGETGAAHSEEDLYAYLLSRERRFWMRALAAQNLAPACLGLFEQLVAVVTLSGGVGAVAETEDLLSRFAAYAGFDRITRESIRNALVAAYGADEGIEPLQPDRLGEYLIARHATPELIALAAFRNRI